MVMRQDAGDMCRMTYGFELPSGWTGNPKPFLRVLSSPLHGLVENRAVGRIDAARFRGLVLDAEHPERQVSRIADGPLACGGDTDDRTLLHRDVHAIDLVFAIARAAVLISFILFSLSVFPGLQAPSPTTFLASPPRRARPADLRGLNEGERRGNAKRAKGLRVGNIGRACLRPTIGRDRKNTRFPKVIAPNLPYGRGYATSIDLQSVLSLSE